MNDIPPEVKQEGFAALGSLIALRFTRTENTKLSQKVFYFFGGWIVSKLFGDPVHSVVGVTLSIEATRALTAMFGLAIVEKIFEMIANFDVKRISQSITEAIEKRFKG